MNIGEMIRNDKGSVSGYIAEPTYDFSNVYLEKVESDNSDAPLFNIMAKSPRGRPCRLGAIWEYAAQKTGEVYFSGYIVSGVSGYVPIRLFRSSRDPNRWNVVRNVPGERRRGAQEVALPEADNDRSADHDLVFGREPEAA